MANAITLRFQGNEVDFFKNDELAAVRARAGMEAAMRDEIELIAPGHRQTKVHMIGAFEIINLASSVNDIEQDLDWLRSRPAVAVATHVFQIETTESPYVPTSNIHLIFKSHLTGHEQQAILNQYRLQATETRGSGDFLVSITAGSRNPIATAAALQKEPNVDLAEPEFVAL